MNGRWVVFCFICLVAHAEGEASTSFERNYVDLQQKIESMRRKGVKISDETRDELDKMLVQMNHEHTELKRQLEEKNRLLNDKISASRAYQRDWLGRAKGAAREFESGLSRAWKRITKEQDEE